MRLWLGINVNEIYKYRVFTTYIYILINYKKRKLKLKCNKQ